MKKRNTEIIFQKLFFYDTALYWKLGSYLNLDSGLNYGRTTKNIIKNDNVDLNLKT